MPIPYSILQERIQIKIISLQKSIKKRYIFITKSYSDIIETELNRMERVIYYVPKFIHNHSDSHIKKRVQQIEKLWKKYNKIGEKIRFGY